MSLLLEYLLVILFSVGLSNCASCPAGGFALRTANPNCPIGTKQCDGGASTRCCPTDLTCLTTSSAWCCSGDEDCRSMLANSPRCPSPDWSLWGSNETFSSNDAWCCAEGSFGITISQQGVVCSTYGATLRVGQATAVRVSTTACASVSSTQTSSYINTLSTTISASATATSGGQTLSAPAGATTTPPEQSHSQLTGGAISGIVIGSLVGVIAGMLVGWFLYRKKRLSGSSPHTIGQENKQGVTATEHQLSEWQGPRYEDRFVPQLEGTPIYER